MERTRTLVRVVVLLSLALVLVIGLAACSSSDTGTTAEPAATGTGGDAGATDQPAAEEDPAVALIETKCSMCHSTDRVWSADKTREEWVVSVDRMKTNGLVVTDDEYTQIIDYLAGQ